MQNTEEQIAHYLFPFKHELQILAQQLREYLKKETKPTTELIGDSTISLNIGYGFTEKAWDCYCAIIVYSKHINISLPSGAILSDPEGLLQGTGKRVRHIKIKSLEDAKTPAAKKILLEARDNALALLEEQPKGKYPVKTIIKNIAGVKKRPG